jgi:hypothetical protein
MFSVFYFYFHVAFGPVLSLPLRRRLFRRYPLSHYTPLDATAPVPSTSAAGRCRILTEHVAHYLAQYRAV